VIHDLDLKLSNGVRVSVREDEGNKLVVFDQNVRSISLEPQEASRLGASLYRSDSESIIPVLARLAESGFFDAPRSLPEIRDQVRQTCPELRGNSLIMALRRLSDKHVLGRTGKRRHYLYSRA
jgi:hypothetical protein